MADIRDLINSIESGNAADIDANFNAVMSAKVGERIDVMRKEFATNLFKNSPADGEIDENSIEEMVPSESGEE